MPRFYDPLTQGFQRVSRLLRRLYMGCVTWVTDDLLKQLRQLQPYAWKVIRLILLNFGKLAFGFLAVAAFIYYAFSAGDYLGKWVLHLPNLNASKVINIAGNVLNLMGLLMISSVLVSNRLGRSLLTISSPFIGFFFLVMFFSLSNVISENSFDVLKPYARHWIDIRTAELKLQNWFTAYELSRSGGLLLGFGLLCIYFLAEYLLKAWNWLAHRFQVKEYPAFMSTQFFGGSLFCCGVALQFASAISDLQEEPGYLLGPPDLTTISEFPDGASNPAYTKRVLTDVAFSPVDEILATVDNKGTVVLWELHKFQITGRLELPEHVISSDWSLTFSQDGKRLGITSRTGDVFIWDVAAMKHTDFSQSHHPITLVFAGEDAIVASDRIEAITLQRLSDGKLLGKKPIDTHIIVMDMVFSSDGSTLAVGTTAPGRGLMITKVLPDGVEWHQLNLDNEPMPVSWTLSADAKRMVIGFVNGSVLMNETYSGRTYNWRAVHRGPVLATAVAPAGNVYASGGADRTVALSTQSESGEWSTRTLRRQHNAPVSSVALSADGKLLASASWDGTVMLWKVECHFSDGEPAQGCALAVLGQHSGSAVRESRSVITD